MSSRSEGAARIARRRRTRVLLAGLAVGSVLAVSACGGSSSGSDGGGGGEFKIGVIGNFTGTDPQSSQDMLRGAEMAVEDVNAKGGVDGKKLKLVVKDGEFKTQASVDAIHGLIDVGKVSSTIMYGGSDILLAVAPYAKAKNTLIVNSASTAPELRKYGGTIFSVLASDDQLADELAAQVKQAGKSRIALVFPNNTFGKSFGKVAAEAVEKSGGEVVSTVAYSEGASSYRSQMQVVKKSGADAIMSAGYGSDSRTIFKDARLIGLDIPWFLLYPTIFVVDDPKWMEGRAFGVDIAAQSLANAGELKKRYKAAHNREPQPVAYYGYDAVSALATSAEKAGSTSPDDLRKQLLSQKFDGVSGAIEFADDGGRVAAPFDEVEFRDGRFQQRAEG